MTRGMAVRGFLTALAIAAGATSASAQIFGTFSWQMQPYCNSVTLTLTSVTGNFTLDGSDDQCGATKKASASGIGVFNPDGTVGLNFTIVLPTGESVDVAASVSPANGQGTWTDNGGNSGTFAFFGATPALPARPDARVYFRSNGHQAALSAGLVVWLAPTHNTGGGTYNSTTGVYTVPRTGLYSISYSIGWVAGAATSGRVCSYLTTTLASTEMASCIPVVGGSGVILTSATATIPLVAGNTIRVGGNETSTDALTLVAGGNDGRGLTITRIQ